MSEPESDLQAHLAALKKKYVAKLPEKIAAIDAGFTAFLSQPWTEEASFTAYRQIHSLAGSAGTYGFAGITEVARAVEAIFKKSLEARETVPAADRTQVNTLMDQLRNMAADAGSEMSR